MSVSIIIVVRESGNLLAAQLRALQPFVDSQSDTEVLVISSAELESVGGVVSSFRDGCPNRPIRHLSVAGRSAAQSRNLGAREARGSLLFFLDDFTEPTPDLVARHRERYLEESVVLSFPMPICSADASLRSSREFLTCSDTYNQRRSAGHRFQYRDFSGCSMLLAREVFRRIGGFDPAAEPLEYIEFGLRLLKDGVRPLCVPEPSGQQQLESSDWRERVQAEAKAAIKIGDRHPETRPQLWGVTGPARLRARILRHFAFKHNEAFEQLLEARLYCIDKFRLRARWRRAFESVREYNYQAGVAEAVGGWSNLTNWLQDGPNAPAVAPDAPLLNLDDPASHIGNDGLVPQKCENGLRVAVRGIEIGAVPPLIGAEPLRWNHLSRWIDQTLRDSGSDLAVNMRDDSEFLPAAQFSIDLADLNRSLYLDRRYGRLDVLVCSKGRPLTSLSFFCKGTERLISPERLRLELCKHGWDPCRDLSEEFLDRAEMPTYPPISVVVCTRDRPASLRNCLKYLARLSYAEFEVVVVDNASRSAEIRDIVTQSGFRYVRENRPGLDWARNRGLEEAQSEIIAYTDDDACVSPGWLQGIARGFRDPQVCAVTGAVLPLEIETKPQALFEEYGGMNKGLLPQVFDRSCRTEFEITAASLCGVGANMAFRREALEQIGRFDTALDVGTPSFGCGDLDVFHRIVASGRTLVYEPSAWIRHRHRRDMASLERQLYSNGRSFWVYLTKIWNERTVTRAACAQVARWWTVRWLAFRLLNRLRHRRGFPLRLIFAEILGTIHGPWAYRETYRHDLELRSTERALADVKSFETAG